MNSSPEVDCLFDFFHKTNSPTLGKIRADARSRHLHTFQATTISADLPSRGVSWLDVGRCRPGLTLGISVAQQPLSWQWTVGSHAIQTARLSLKTEGYSILRKHFCIQAWGYQKSKKNDLFKIKGVSEANVRFVLLLLLLSLSLFVCVCVCQS